MVIPHTVDVAAVLLEEEGEVGDLLRIDIELGYHHLSNTSRHKKMFNHHFLLQINGCSHCFSVCKISKHLVLMDISRLQFLAGISGFIAFSKYVLYILERFL